MADSRTRGAERAAKQNPTDKELAQRLEAERARTGDHDYAHLVGSWVSVFGVRQHYRGKLLRVTYGTLGARLHLSPCYDLDSAETTENQQELPSTPECPVVLVETAILATSLQLETLPEE